MPGADDYCDCLDGPDEPGTSACGHATSRFFCLNTGFKSKYVRSGLVGDGICDCCDGSDEWASGLCPNTCREAGDAARREAASVLSGVQAGVAVAQKWSADAASTKAGWESSIAALKVTLSEKQAAAAAIEEEKKVAEARESEQREVFLKKKAEEEAAQKVAEEAKAAAEAKSAPQSASEEAGVSDTVASDTVASDSDATGAPETAPTSQPEPSQDAESIAAEPSLVESEDDSGADAAMPSGDDHAPDDPYAADEIAEDSEYRMPDDDYYAASDYQNDYEGEYRPPHDDAWDEESDPDSKPWHDDEQDEELSSSVGDATHGEPPKDEGAYSLPQCTTAPTQHARIHLLRRDLLGMLIQKGVGVGESVQRATGRHLLVGEALEVAEREAGGQHAAPHLSSASHVLDPRVRAEVRGW